MESTYQKITRLWDAMRYQDVQMYYRPVYFPDEDCIGSQCTYKTVLAKEFRGRFVFNKMQIYKIIKNSK